MKWTAPADDGGSLITAYRVVILKTGTEIENENITDPDTTSLSVGSLERNTEYAVKVFARNFVFEGPVGEKTVRTKYKGKNQKDVFFLRLSHNTYQQLLLNHLQMITNFMHGGTYHLS